MRKQRALLVGAIILLLLFFNITQAFASAFKDMAGNWAETEVNEMYSKGVISGYQDGTFRPNNPVTRQEFAKILVKAFNLPLTTPSKPTFTDVPASSWAYPYIESAKNYMAGEYSANQRKVFRPKDNATREEIAVALVKAKGLTPAALINPNLLQISFSDYSRIAPGNEVYVALSVENGLVKGFPDGTFKGLNQVTRGQVSVMASRAIKTSAVEQRPLDETIPTTNNSTTTEQTIPTVDTSVKLSVQEIAKNKRSVVYISTFDTLGNPLAVGSGFVLRQDGIIATNYHVIEGAASAQITFDSGESFKVEGVVGYDKDKDISLLKVNKLNLIPIDIGDSDKVELGEDVVVIGNPQGLQNTVSTGIVSTTKREVGGYNYIQITAPISPGSSGGPVLNMYGKVIGLATASYGAPNSQNLNIAVPINDVVRVLSDATGSMISLDKLFPVITTSDDYQAFLNNMLTNLEFGPYEISGSAYVYEKPDSKGKDTIMVGIYFDSANTVTWYKILLNLEAREQMEDFLLAIVNHASKTFGKPVFGGAWYELVSGIYPSGHDSSEIGLISNKWHLLHLLATFDNSITGEGMVSFRTGE